MLSGFNTNYRHRGVLFHVQTEDSGLAHPHVITHLFHGGNIVASHKRDYKDKLGAADLEAEVKSLMERQHKEMLQQLRRGDHDEAIVARLGDRIFADPTDRDDESADALPTPSQDAPTATDALPPAHASGPDPARDRLARAFGEGIVSEKPLDEVVLDYLVENARKRKRGSTR